MSPAHRTIPQKWRGKACRIFTFEDSARLETIGGKPDTYLLDGLTVRSLANGRNYWMREGSGKGLEQNRDALSGRCIMARAISLAVHLGASDIFLAAGAPVSPRARRNLETMIRPLKSKRITIRAEARLETPFPALED